MFLTLTVALVVVAPLAKAADVTVTAIKAVGANSFFLTSDGVLWGMGDNTYGQLGPRAAQSTLPLVSRVPSTELDPRATATQSTPVQIASNVASMDGGETIFWVTKEGELWGMGDNYEGILGDGTYQTIRRSPVHIASNVAAVVNGFSSSMFLTKDGKLWGIGGNDCGELGESTLTGPVTRSSQGYGASFTPVQVASDVIGMFHSISQTMFLTSDHTLWGMGYNGGAINTSPDSLGCFLGPDATGFNNNYRQYIPVPIASNVDSIRSEDYGLVTVDGELYKISHGQLVLVNVPSGEKVISAVLGSEYSCSLFVTDNGNLWAKGGNYNGELGIGDATAFDLPVLVASNVAMAATGGGGRIDSVYGDDGTLIAFHSVDYDHSLFVTKDGKLWGMGSNNYGQLGIGVTSGIIPYPVQIQIPDPAEITKTMESNVSNASSTTESNGASSGNASATGSAGTGGSAGGGAPSLLYLAVTFTLLALRRFKRR